MLLGTPTELPDSLQDGAQQAAQACVNLLEAQGPGGRCRVDIDTSVGDETFTLQKRSTEFMQLLVTYLCYLQMPHLQQQQLDDTMRVVTAKTELTQLELRRNELVEQLQQSMAQSAASTAETAETAMIQVNATKEQLSLLQQDMDQLQDVINRGGRDPNYQYQGPICRIYFPDEGSAALARRDWLTPPAKSGGGNAPLVPPCVEFSSCGGVQLRDISKDQLVFFYCPRASEAKYVEQILQDTELKASEQLQLIIFVNPILVDMGVTGFGMAGRLLRERLIDPLPYAYYLRTLAWGALTRVWPRDFSIWQEDDNEDGGYRLIRTLSQLPSNPEVEDIYDVTNGLRDSKTTGGGGGGVWDQLGDFVNGMMRL